MLRNERAFAYEATEGWTRKYTTMVTSRSTSSQQDKATAAAAKGGGYH